MSVEDVMAAVDALTTFDTPQPIKAGSLGLIDTEAITARQAAKRAAVERAVEIAIAEARVEEHRITSDHRDGERWATLHGCIRCQRLEAELEELQGG